MNDDNVIYDYNVSEETPTLGLARLRVALVEAKADLVAVVLSVVPVFPRVVLAIDVAPLLLGAYRLVMVKLWLGYGYG